MTDIKLLPNAQKMLERVERIIAKNQGGQETLVTILHEVQDRFGYIPRQALDLISQRKNLFLSTLYRLVTSYRAFRIEKPEKHIITFCNGTGCHVNSGESLLKESWATSIQNSLNITVEKVRCLGCCNMSPALMIDGEVYSGQDAQVKIAEILSE